MDETRPKLSPHSLALLELSKLALTRAEQLQRSEAVLTAALSFLSEGKYELAKTVLQEYKR